MAEISIIDIAALRAEENFVADAQLLLHELMLAKGVTRAELAHRLSVSRPRISQLFSSDCKNFTVRLLARALHALGEEAQLSCAWTRARECMSHARQIAELSADPGTNVVSLWAEDGVIVPPDDLRGECSSDPRLRALLRARGEARHEAEMQEAA